MYAAIHEVAQLQDMASKMWNGEKLGEADSSAEQQAKMNLGQTYSN